jgi:hypothetical protein
MLYGKLCYVVDIRPRAHNFSLIEGTAWVDSQGFSLLRIEGRPGASPSFWTGRPFIERESTVSDGLSFPQHSRAHVQRILRRKIRVGFRLQQI